MKTHLRPLVPPAALPTNSPRAGTWHLPLSKPLIPQPQSLAPVYLCFIYLFRSFPLPQAFLPSPQDSGTSVRAAPAPRNSHLPNHTKHLINNNTINKIIKVLKAFLPLPIKPGALIFPSWQNHAAVFLPAGSPALARTCHITQMGKCLRVF